MSANTILTSIVTGGTNSHATTAEEANALATDFIAQGIVGAYTLNIGSGGTGSFCVNADAAPDMGITIKAGQAYISATPSGQNAQVLRARASADYTVYTINANASGSTKYDWIYLKVDPTNSNNPAADASNVTSIYTSRSSSNASDNGSPPTYGLVLAVVTVANGASSITNSNITDKRVAATIGTANSTLTTYEAEGTFDYVASGLVITGDSYGSTLAGSITSGVVYIGGARNTVAAVAAHTFGASLDTYIDVLYSSTGVGTVVYTPVSNNTASPALAASSIRIGIVVTGATNIASVASINQGQETKVLPIASSVPYAVTDSLGNLICPRDPNRRILGYRQVLSGFTTTNTTATDITGLTCPVIVPTGRKVKVSIGARFMSSSGGGATGVVASVQDKTASAIIGQKVVSAPASSYACDPTCYATVTPPASGSRTYQAQGHNESAGTYTYQGAAGMPAYILVELA